MGIAIVIFVSVCLYLIFLGLTTFLTKRLFEHLRKRTRRFLNFLIALLLFYGFYWLVWWRLLPLVMD